MFVCEASSSENSRLEKTGSGGDCGVAGTTTSDKDSEMVDAEDARI